LIGKIPGGLPPINGDYPLAFAVLIWVSGFLATNVAPPTTIEEGGIHRESGLDADDDLF
jgi:hypothetical protein